MPDGAYLKAGRASELLPKGSKGERTRRRIMDATNALLAERPFADIRITDIARAADIVQPNFYTYFPSVEAVVLALAKEISADALGVHIQPDWRGEAGLAHARGLVAAGIEFWTRHREIFSIVNLLADKRRGEFAAVRVRQVRAIYKGFEAKVRDAQAAGAISPAVTPRLAGYECVALLSSAGIRCELMLASGFSREQVIETTARLLHLIATGGTA
ncbi:MAG: TetR/AcrR family transcriptional regulator [Caulobacteraceae bacterium]|nr:TetR/AcrR family transcriptional regulator [Caulobacteraceae bacterium]